MQQNEHYVLGVLQEGGLLTRQQIDGARSRLNGEPGVLDVLFNDGALSEVDVSRALAAQAHMDWIDISTIMLLPAGGTGTVTAIADPFGYSYGYSTRMAANGSGGYNPTFDLWSTAALTNSPPTAGDQNQWIKNW
jgi:hypothetical protein